MKRDEDFENSLANIASASGRWLGLVSLWLKRMVLRNGAVRLARSAPRAALGFVDSVDRAAHADDLESFVLRQIAPY